MFTLSTVKSVSGSSLAWPLLVLIPTDEESMFPKDEGVRLIDQVFTRKALAALLQAPSPPIILKLFSQDSNWIEGKALGGVTRKKWAMCGSEPNILEHTFASNLFKRNFSSS